MCPTGPPTEQAASAAAVCDALTHIRRAAYARNKEEKDVESQEKEEEEDPFVVP